MENCTEIDIPSTGTPAAAILDDLARGLEEIDFVHPEKDVGIWLVAFRLIDAKVILPTEGRSKLDLQLKYQYREATKLPDNLEKIREDEKVFKQKILIKCILNLQEKHPELWD